MNVLRSTDLRTIVTIYSLQLSRAENCRVQSPLIRESLIFKRLKSFVSHFVLGLNDLIEQFEHTLRQNTFGLPIDTARAARHIGD